MTTSENRPAREVPAGIAADRADQPSVSAALRDFRAAQNWQITS